MHTGTVLGTTEAEFISSSKLSRMAVPLMNLLEEMAEKLVGTINKISAAYCKVLRDNLRAQTMATMPEIRIRKKYINTKHQNFRVNLEHSVPTLAQISDLLTKPLADSEFTTLSFRIVGLYKAKIGADLLGVCTLEHKRIARKTHNNGTRANEKAALRSKSRSQLRK